MKTARELLQTYLDAVSPGDMEKAIALFADDGAIKFPYFGSVNLPTRYQGPEALRQFFALTDAGEHDSPRTPDKRSSASQQLSESCARFLRWLSRSRACPRR